MLNLCFEYKMCSTTFEIQMFFFYKFANMSCFDNELWPVIISWSSLEPPWQNLSALSWDRRQPPQWATQICTCYTEGAGPSTSCNPNLGRVAWAWAFGCKSHPFAHPQPKMPSPAPFCPPSCLPPTQIRPYSSLPWACSSTAGPTRLLSTALHASHWHEGALLLQRHRANISSLHWP